MKVRHSAHFILLSTLTYNTVLRGPEDINDNQDGTFDKIFDYTSNLASNHLTFTLVWRRRTHLTRCRGSRRSRSLWRCRRQRPNVRSGCPEGCSQARSHARWSCPWIARSLKGLGQTPSTHVRFERGMRGGGIQEVGRRTVLRTQDPLDQGTRRKAIGRVGWLVWVASSRISWAMITNIW